MSQDNPVPSILQISFKNELTAKYIKACIEKSFPFLKSRIKLINGVETNKVQPKSASKIMREWNKDKCTCGRYRCNCKDIIY